LLTDYEFRRESLNGIYRCNRKSNMKERHVLVTNKYLSDIREFEEKSNFLKMFCKMYLNDIIIDIN
jgi:hypothetical protein